MIRVYAPEIRSSDLDGGTRVGACIMVEDAEHILCIESAGEIIDKLENDPVLSKIYKELYE